MAISIYFELEGATTGKIAGGCRKTDEREGMMECVEFDHSVHLPIDPVDATKINGNRRHAPIRLTKVTDKATPLIANMVCRGEDVTEAKLHFYEISPAGEEVEYYTITLRDAKVVEFAPLMLHSKAPEYQIYPHQERIALAYKEIEWMIVEGAIVASDSYQKPNA